MAASATSAAPGPIPMDNEALRVKWDSFAKDYSQVMEQWSFPSFCALVSCIGASVLAGEAATHAGEDMDLSKSARPLVLDIGCGPGGHTLAFARMHPTIRVLGLDLSPGMIEIAIGRAASLEAPPRNLAFGVASADSEAAATDGLLSSCEFRPVVSGVDALATKTDLADAAIANLVFMIVPDTLTALKGLASSVKPGAPVAMALWGSPDRSPLFTLLGSAIRDAGLAGTGSAPQQSRRSNFHLGIDPEVTAKLLESAGFESVSYYAMDLPMPGGPIVNAVEGAERLMNLTPGNMAMVSAIKESSAGKAGVTSLREALISKVQDLLDARQPLALNVLILAARRRSE